MNENYAYLEYSNRKHHKFYEIKIVDNSVVIKFGRIGYIGATKIKIFSCIEETLKYYNRQLNQKTKRGYAKAIKGKRLPRLKHININQLEIPFY